MRPELEADEVGSPRTPTGAAIPKPMVCPGAPRPPAAARRLPIPPAPWRLVEAVRGSPAIKPVDGKAGLPLRVCLPGPPATKRRLSPSLAPRPPSPAEAALKRRRSATTRPFSTMAIAVMFASKLRRAARRGRVCAAPK